MDIDIIVRISGEKDVGRLVSALRGAGLKVDEKAVCNVLKSGYRILTIRDEKTPYSVDIIISEKSLVEDPL